MERTMKSSTDTTPSRSRSIICSRETASGSAMSTFKQKPHQDEWSKIVLRAIGEDHAIPLPPKLASGCVPCRANFNGILFAGMVHMNDLQEHGESPRYSETKDSSCGSSFPSSALPGSCFVGIPPPCASPSPQATRLLPRTALGR